METNLALQTARDGLTAVDEREGETQSERGVFLLSG